MDKIVDHLFIFKGNGIVEDFPGNYSDHRAYEDSNVLEQRADKGNNTQNKSNKNSWRSDDKSKKLSFEEQKEYNKLEKSIQNLEKQKVELQNQFANTGLSGEEIDVLSIRLKDIIENLEDKTERWFELSMLMED
jgi:ATP-binding cassette subfamily F protein uup